MASILSGRERSLMCVGGPCAGIRVVDTGAEIYRVAVPPILGMLRGRDGAPAEYHRCEFGFDDVQLVVLVHGTIERPADVIQELLRGYSYARATA